MLELNLTQNTNSNIQANGYNPVGGGFESGGD